MQTPAIAGGLTARAAIAIEAEPELVWAVLADLAEYGEWNTFVPVVQSKFQVGSLLHMRVQMRRGLRVRMTTRITRLDEPYRMAWRTRMPHWLLSSERVQELTRIGPHMTQYQTSETFTGALTPLLRLLFEKDLQRGFENVARNLKARVETLSRAG